MGTENDTKSQPKPTRNQTILARKKHPPAELFARILLFLILNLLSYVRQHQLNQFGKYDVTCGSHYLYYQRLH